MDRLGYGADLVDLEQQRIARLLLDRHLDPARIRREQVVPDNLDLRSLRKARPCFPVVLPKRVLKKHNRILLRQAVVQRRELCTGEPPARVRFGILKVKVVFAVLEELGRGGVECDLDLAFITGLVDRLGDQVERFVCSGDVGGKSALIADIDSFTESAHRLYI